MDILVPQTETKRSLSAKIVVRDADADVDAAKVILLRGLNELGINLDAVSSVPRQQGKSTPKEPVARQGKSPAWVSEPGKPQQLELYE